MSILLFITLIGKITVSLTPQTPADLYNKNIAGSHLHQCILPIIYAYSENVDDNTIKLIENSIDYWNSIYGKKLFTGIGTLPLTYVSARPKIVVLIDVLTSEEYNKKFRSIELARVEYNKLSRKDGCIIGGTILLKKDELNNTKNTKKGIENVIRHELGHILGFGHNRDSNGLMYISIDPNIDKYKTLTEKELKAFNLYYNK